MWPCREALASTDRLSWRGASATGSTTTALVLCSGPTWTRLVTTDAVSTSGHARHGRAEGPRAHGVLGLEVLVAALVPKEAVHRAELLQPLDGLGIMPSDAECAAR